MLLLPRTLWALVALCAVWITGTPEALAQKRVALVIGNSTYQHATALPNPKNDASDLARVLKQLNFEVVEGRDLDKASMDRTIRNFADKLAGSQISLFFYAGHGLQVGGQNYLVPIDAKLSTGAALDFETVRLDLIQRTMERESTTSIFIVDACRDNPLARNLARALGTRSASVGRGLAAMESGEGTLISFSTQPGNVALDGKGRNSPFAAALIKHLPTQGDDLPTILINVRNDVMAATERRQVPWEHSALTARVYFVPPKPEPPAINRQIELSFWDAVKDSQVPQVLQTYVDRYPEGEFVAIARALIQHHERQAKAAEVKRVESQQKEPGNIAALPELSKSARGLEPFDGLWTIETKATNCISRSSKYPIQILGSRISNKAGAKGAIEPSGSARWSAPSRNRDATVEWQGTFKGTSGAGTFAAKGHACRGSFIATRQ
jgi:hypothetical protein